MDFSAWFCVGKQGGLHAASYWGSAPSEVSRKRLPNGGEPEFKCYPESVPQLHNLS